ncbi:hypothetical protein JRQ81_010727 [Phrynocephalus forsythii]|uniref:Uncharacterized protein n=1 Tax=Phrynocephalus forsythii TaxID=171643 RepID=A0A9Q0Y125_9SAUR|nr:hypothetical protein JRQ81_010727 [Phrynocephalus forsythii]
MAKPRSHLVNATTESFKVSNLIAKKCKPFTEGEFVKDCCFEAADNFFEGFKNKKEIIAAIQDVHGQETPSFGEQKRCVETQLNNCWRMFQIVLPSHSNWMNLKSQET